MNPESGWEKENVENKVGYLRRNELVPVPRFNDLAEENRHLLERCESDMQREHYDDDDNRFISELFEEDNSLAYHSTRLFTRPRQQINMASLPLMQESTVILLHRLFVSQSSILRLHHLL